MKRTPSHGLRAWVATFAWAVLGCSSTPPPRDSAVAVPASAAAGASTEPTGCPPIQRMQVATLEENSGGKLWVLHEVLNERPASPTEANPEQPLTEAEARALGARSNTDPIWLLKSGAAPCRMKPGPFLLQRSQDVLQYERVVRVLEGACPGSVQAERAFAFQQAEEPSRCRLSQVETLPRREPPADLIPKKSCEEPDCEYRSSIKGGEIPGGGVVLDIVATWLYPTKEDQCSWNHDDFYAVVVQTAAGRPFVRIDTIDVLHSVLTDAQGLRAVIGDEPWLTTVVPFTT